MENPEHLFELCEVHLPHGYDQTHMKELTIEFLHILMCVCWLPKPKFHRLKVLFFLGWCQ